MHPCYSIERPQTDLLYSAHVMYESNSTLNKCLPANFVQICSVQPSVFCALPDGKTQYMLMTCCAYSCTRQRLNVTLLCFRLAHSHKYPTHVERYDCHNPLLESTNRHTNIWGITTNISRLPVLMNWVDSLPMWQASCHLILKTCLSLVSSFFHQPHPLGNLHGQNCEVSYTSPALATLPTTTASRSLHAN